MAHLTLVRFFQANNLASYWRN